MSSRLLGRLLTATLMCIATSSMCCAEPTESDTTPKPVVLTGSVEHSEHLGTVDEKLRPGKPFLQSQLPKIDSWANGRWCRIPNWMAGREWSHEQLTKVYEEDLQTHKVDSTETTETARGGETWGWQRDKNGDVWHYNRPLMSRDEGDKEFTIHLHYQPWESVSFEPNRMVFRAVGTHIDVDKQTNLIKSTLQAEHILVTTPITDGVIRTDMSAKIFDADGQPKSLKRTFEIKRLVRPFQPWNFDSGRDVRTAFYQYLAANGMSNLIPPQPSGGDKDPLPGLSITRSGNSIHIGPKR